MAVLRSFARLTQISAFAVMMLVASLPLAKAQDEVKIQLQEHKIKAGLLYNFLKYTSWPTLQLKQDLRVCLLGGDPFDGSLHLLDGRTAQQAIIRISEIRSARQATECQLVFIHTNQQIRVAELLKTFNGKPILTVSDINRFSNMGGIVELSMQEDQRIHIFINRDALQTAQIKIEPRLMNLAKMVHSNE